MVFSFSRYWTKPPGADVRAPARSSPRVSGDEKKSPRRLARASGAVPMNTELK
jgi:hypothetical protein